MADERLPIKFFDKREVDKMRVEGGGSKKPPKFILSENELHVKARAYENTFEAFLDIVSKKEQTQSVVPFVFTAKLIKDAKAKTHRSKVSSLLRAGNDNNVLGLAGVDELLIKLEDSRDVHKIIERLQDADNNAHAISAIESIQEFSPKIYKEVSKEKNDYKVKLIDFQNEDLNAYIRSKFESYIERKNFKVKKTYYTPEHVVFNLKSIEIDEFINTQLDSIERNDILEAIFSIEPMPKFSVSLDMLDEEEEEVEIIKPVSGKKYATVGILDSGIQDIPQLKPWIVSENYTAYPEQYKNKGHGTFVSGVVAYGDALENKQWVGTEGVKLLDACVFPDESIEKISEDELVNNIKAAVRLYKDSVKVWNLSISGAEEVRDDRFSDFAAAIDDLQDECNVLICKSAGNCRNFITGKPKGRIHRGADSVRSIVVGSLAHAKVATDLADIDNISPFSRVGRGPSYIIKPELVHYGGNASVSPRGKIIKNGVKSFGIDGSITTAIGTSFSTPRVASLAAGLYQEMDEEFDPLLIKALMVHSASYSENLKIPMDERVDQVGFGKPKSVREILYNSPNEITLILRDEMLKGEYLDIMEFPMPESLIENGFYTGQIVLTLVYNPIIIPSQGAEYCQSDIEVKMGTFDNKFDRDTTRQMILNPVGKNGAKNVLLETNYSKKTMKAKTDDFALKERLLIQYGEKYYPVKKYAVDLADMTESNRIKFLTSDKKWYLFLNGLYRDHIEKKAQLEGQVPRQKFCLIVTIRDPKGNKPVYDEVNHKLDEFNFTHNNLKLQTDIHVRY